MQVVGVDGRVVGYLFCFLILQAKLTNSRTSWRLSADKVVKTTEYLSGVDEDPIFDILTTSIGNGQAWSKTSSSSSTENREKVVYCQDCNGLSTVNQERRYSYMLKSTRNTTAMSTTTALSTSGCSLGQSCEDVVLDCGKPVNFTYYDNLNGVANRHQHPLAPEPAVALMFKKNTGKPVDVDIDLLERRLKRAKREKPKSVQLYNQIEAIRITTNLNWKLPKLEPT